MTTTFLSTFLRELGSRRNLAASAALVFLLVVAVLSAAAPLLPIQDPLAIDTLNILSGPSQAHWLGTDELGRDILSRIIHGGRISLGVALSAVLLAGVLGTFLGVLIGFCGPRVEAVAMRLIDVFVSLPEIFVALIALALLGGGLGTLIGTIGLIYCPQFARVVYNMTRSIRAREHVLAARSLGAGRLWLIRHEALPNLYSIIAVQASVTFSFALLMEAGLSFLGLGVQPPTPSWGQMVGILKNYIYINPWSAVFPGLALFFVVLAVNLVGDLLQDVLNPELRK